MTTTEIPTSTDEAAAADLTTARARNESTWRAAAIALYTGDIEGYLRLWTTDCRYAVAYPVEGIPAVVEGQEAFAQLFGGFAAAAERISVHDVRFHQTDDPDVAFVEERMVADLHGGGRYENTLAIRATFRDGLLREIYEYYGQVAHQALAAGLGAGR